jgi:hypothetical protein
MNGRAPAYIALPMILTGGLTAGLVLWNKGETPTTATVMGGWLAAVFLGAYVAWGHGYRIFGPWDQSDARSRVSRLILVVILVITVVLFVVL